MNAMKTEFSKRLRGLRERKHLSRRTLAELCGLSKNMVSRYENGEAEPTALILIELADRLEVSVDFLLGRKENI